MINNGSFSYRQLAGNGPIMVIIPHEDDEINLAGASIYRARQEGIRVICVFVTNGDWEYPGAVRMQEAIRSLRQLGVLSEDIIFLGYPDGGVHGERSVFLHGRKKTVQAGKHHETYGMTGIDDYSFHENGYHHSYRWEFLLADMESVILKFKPSLIISVDFDFHADHRMCSIAFETVMGNVLRKQGQYHPVVFKGFCYTTGFESYNDFFEPHFYSSRIRREILWDSAYETDNPCYQWERRIRIPVPEKCRESLSKNVLFKALSYHISQKAFGRAGRIINGDQVFWQRRTDNLIYRGTVTASSGEVTYLYDFKMMDTDEIGMIHPAMNHYLWVPDADDKDKWCFCRFNQPQHVEAVALYGNIDDDSRVLQGKLSLSTGYSCLIGPIEKHGQETWVTIPPQDNVMWVKLEIQQTKGDRAGLSEWEILENANESLPYIQITVDGHFAYDWAVYPGEKPQIDVYHYGLSEDFKWFMDGESKTLEEINEEVANLKETAIVRVEAADHPNIWCEGRFIPADFFYQMKLGAVRQWDHFWIWLEKQKEKWPHHQLHKLKISK